MKITGLLYLFIDNNTVSIFRENVLVSFSDWSGNDRLGCGIVTMIAIYAGQF